MSNIKIRKAIRSDHQEIVKMVRSENLNPMNLKWQNFSVAESAEKEIIAIAQLKEHRDGSIELSSLVVKPQLRGTGLAGAMIKDLINDQSGTVYLMCRSGLGSFYEKFGFMEVPGDEMPRYFMRIHKLFSKLKKVFRRDESLLIMSLSKK